MHSFTYLYIIFLILLINLKILDKIIKKSFYKRTQQRNSLLKAIIFNINKFNKYYSYYILKNYRDYLISSLNLLYYFKYIYLNKSYYNI
jgi:ABC-type transport system involved in cytochrome bd biosynthesis fused ATPase/permease subunit